MDGLLYLLKNTKFPGCRRPNIILGEERIDGLLPWRKRELMNGKLKNNLDFTVLNSMGTYEGITLGIKHCRRGKRTVPCKDNRTFNTLFLYLDQIIKEKLPDFSYTGIHVAHNLLAKRHTDKNNTEESYFLELGDHIGGGLRTANGDLTERCVFQKFDARLWHESLPWHNSNRYSIIVYDQVKVDKSNGVINIEPRTFKFVQPHSTGASPSYVDDLFTLTLCKPRIREQALPKDIVVACCPLYNKIMWFGLVAEVLDHRHYSLHCLENFPHKLHSKENWQGDCLFRPTKDGYLRVSSPLEHLGVAKQLVECPKTIIFRDFSYYGEGGPVDRLKIARRGFFSFKFTTDFHLALCNQKIRQPILKWGDATLSKNWYKNWDNLPRCSHNDRFEYFNEVGLRVFPFRITNKNIVWKDTTEYYELLQKQAGMVPVKLKRKRFSKGVEINSSLIYCISPYRLDCHLGHFCSYGRFTQIPPHIQLYASANMDILVQDEHVTN